jgi:hypothetical protein
MRTIVALFLLSAVGTGLAPVETSQPPVVGGWREYPLRDGVIAIKTRTSRNDTVDVQVPPGKGLEYKLTMKQGDTLVYNISFRGLADPAQMVSEFHGHTPQVNGVGDLMFYSKTNGSPQSGSFTAPMGWHPRLVFEERQRPRRRRDPRARRLLRAGRQVVRCPTSVNRCHQSHAIQPIAIDNDSVPHMIDVP